VSAKGAAWRTIALLAVVSSVVLSAFAGVTLTFGSSAHGAPSPAPAAPITPSVSPTLQKSSYPSPGPQCDGVYWAGYPTWRYVPNYCYGHDEPTISYVSNAPHSGEDASFQMVLPADCQPVGAPTATPSCVNGTTEPQGDFFAALWFGGTVYDPQSMDNQAFLELQFYPSPPQYTGPGSGSLDCLGNGAFNPVWHPGASTWFACAVMWEINSAGSEVAAYAGPMDLGFSPNEQTHPAGDTEITMLAGDHLFVNYSGVAQSSPWTISIVDTGGPLNALASPASSTVVLVNGTQPLSPYYATAAASNVMLWGASAPGAIAWAYEIGHTLNPYIDNEDPANGGCLPGDATNLTSYPPAPQPATGYLSCFSYWPGKWSQTGQMQLAIPVLGNGTSASYPPQIAFSSSQGAQTEVNESTCLAPSFLQVRNCMYPFFLYRAGFHSLTFDADLSVANITHDYGNEFEFPSNPTGTPAGVVEASPHHTVAAPWGTVNVLYGPATATVSVTPIGPAPTQALTVSGSVASGEFLEGPYYLNVSAPGCAAYSSQIYVGTGATLTRAVALNCGSLSAVAGALSPTSGTAPLSVSFLGAASGGLAPYTLAWDFGDGSSALGATASHVFGKAGLYSVTLLAEDALGAKATAKVAVDVLPSTPVRSSPADVTLYAQNVTPSVTATGSSLPSAYFLRPTFPTGQTDLNSGYLFPGPISPTSWTFSLRTPTAAPLYLSTSAPFVAHFFLSVNAVNATVPVPAGVPVTVVASLASDTFLGSGSQTLELNPGGAVAEFNVSFATNVSVVPAGSPLVLTVTWFSAQVPGASNATSGAVSGTIVWQVNIHSGAAYPIGIDLPLLDPVYLSAPLLVQSASATAVTATVASPFGTADLASVVATLDGSSVAPSVSGSNYTWSFPTGTIPAGYHLFVVTATDGQGASNRATVVFQTVATYPITFTETGLPSGTGWSVTLAGSTVGSGSGSSIILHEPNGSYSYDVGVVAGYLSAPTSGVVTVAGAGTSVGIVFFTPNSGYTVTFQEKGLHGGTPWQIDVAGEVLSSNTTRISLTLPNGSYAFTVVAVPGYTAKPSSGTITVSGANLTVTIRFR
jgi:hypothetical protein